MTPQQFQAIYPAVIGWIRQTLTVHAGNSRTVASRGFRRLPGYFSPELLAETKVVGVPQVPMPPLSALGLSQFAAFENGNYAGVTYIDTFFVRSDYAADEHLHFHELIHAVQWRILGPEKFLAAYASGLEAFGYENSPLEVMAYTGQGRFAQSQQLFDAEKWVADELSRIGVA